MLESQLWHRLRYRQTDLVSGSMSQPEREFTDLAVEIWQRYDSITQEWKLLYQSRERTLGYD